MDPEERHDDLTEIEERYAGYEVFDREGRKIGKVDELFVDENDHPEYLGVKMGFLGLEGMSLIPWEMVRVDEGQGYIEVAESKDKVKDAPSFSDEEEITSEYEKRIHSHFGLQGAGTTGERGRYGVYYSGAEEAHTASTAQARRGVTT